MRGGGTVNADGFGVGWYPTATGTPVALPAGRADLDRPDPARAGRGDRAPARCWRRSRSRDGRHAGRRDGRRAVRRRAVAVQPQRRGAPAGRTRSAELAGALPVRDLLTLEAPTDAALLWALVRHRLRAGARLAEALAATVGRGRRRGPGLPAQPAAHRRHVGRGHDRGATRCRCAAAGGAVLVASEPLDDDPGWQPVPDRALRAWPRRRRRTSRAPLTECNRTLAIGEDTDERVTAGDPSAGADLDRALRADVRTGLTADPKWLPPKWFYDARGSELFEEITRLPEYYPTRAERAILAARAADDRRGHRREDAGRARLGLVGEDPAAARRATAARRAGHVRAAGRVGDARCGSPTARSPPTTRGCGCTASSATSPVTWTALPDRRRPAGGVPRRHHRQPAAGRAGRRSWPPCARRWSPAMAAARHRPGQGPGGAGAGLRRRGRGDRRVQPQRAAGDQPRAWTPTSTWTRSPTWRCWDPEQEWIEMRLRARRPMRGHGPARSTWTVDFAAGEEMRTEVSAKFRPDGHRGRAGRGRLRGRRSAGPTRTACSG